MKKLMITISIIAIMLTICACGGSGSSNDALTKGDPISKDEIQDLYSSPSDFKGRGFDFTAKVISVEKDGDTLYIQAMYDKENYEKNTIIEYVSEEINVDNDDFIKVSGVVKGEFKGENALGGTVTAPHIVAESVEVVDAVDAYPAEATYEVNKSITKGSCEVTLTKVDFTEDETRVFVTIKNNNSSEISMYPDQGVIIQDGNQYEVNDRYRYDFMQSDIKAGCTVRGVVAFDKVDERSLSFEFSGSDTDYNSLDFRFDIEI